MDQFWTNSRRSRLTPAHRHAWQSAGGCINVSGLPVARWPRWRSARPGPHKGVGVGRHLPPQVAETPVDCQAIFLSPPADFASQAPQRRFFPIRPTQRPATRRDARDAGAPRRCAPSWPQAQQRPCWYELDPGAAAATLRTGLPAPEARAAPPEPLGSAPCAGTCSRAS